MSQKKVDEYKKYKKNRRENIKKEKRKERLIMTAIWGAVVLFIVCAGGAMGVTIYNKYQAKQAALPTYGSTSFILADMANIQKEDAQNVTEESEEESSESETSETETSEAAASEESSEEETGTQTENEETESESAEN